MGMTRNISARSPKQVVISPRPCAVCHQDQQPWASRPEQHVPVAAHQVMRSQRNPWRRLQLKICQSSFGRHALMLKFKKPVGVQSGEYIVTFIN
eukprot:1279734-Pyramimonas_sp.AAC.1